MTCIHERNKREVWFLTSSQLVWDDAQLQEKIRKKKFKKFLDFRRELTFWLCSTDLISAHIQSPKLVTTFWKQADNPVFWSDSSS